MLPQVGSVECDVTAGSEDSGVALLVLLLVGSGDSGVALLVLLACIYTMHGERYFTQERQRVGRSADRGV